LKAKISRFCSVSRDVSKGAPSSAITLARGTPGVNTARFFLPGALAAIITEHPVELDTRKRHNKSKAECRQERMSIMQTFELM
jgi:hypothetical protein